MESLEGLLRACTARVMDGERFCGSGFAVAPDRVVTCAHVVAGSSPGLVVWLGTRSVAVVGVDAFPPEPPPGCVSFPLPDLALLLLEQRVAAAGGDAGAGVWLTEGLPATGAELLGVGFSADFHAATSALG